jgi:excisionase family DNA binding protein
MTDTAPAVPLASRKTKAPEYFLTINEAAECLGLSRATLLREIDRGNLKCSQEIPVTTTYTRRRFLAEDLIAYCRDNPAWVLHVERLIKEKLAA